MSKVLVVGASEKLERYSNQAVRMLLAHQHEVFAFGNREGEIEGIPISKIWPVDSSIDTVTLYLNPLRQEVYYQAIIDLKPRRVIFNPGTENPAFEEVLEEKGILAEEACTLVLLSTGLF